MASHYFFRLAATRRTIPLAATAIVASPLVQDHRPTSKSITSQCESQAPNPSAAPSWAFPGQQDRPREQGMRPSEEGDYHGLFPKRQLWHPKYNYPLWDRDWDERDPPSTGDKEKDRERMRYIRKTGVTRHIILIRHGQYDESSKEDEKRKLTPLGQRQADLTGKRLAEMLQGAQQDESFGPCKIKVLRVSGMTRAKETADIIATHLPEVEYVEPDPLLNEGRPCHTIPGGKATPKVVELTDENHPRIEQAFQKYFYRSPVSEDFEGTTATPSSDVQNDASGETKGYDVPEDEKHEFEVIVCHANVIRYFLCRALQLPPEAWLRYCPFNCSMTYITIRPTGSVSCRLLGDIGHLPYDAATFSRHHGYNW